MFFIVNIELIINVFLHISLSVDTNSNIDILSVSTVILETCNVGCYFDLENKIPLFNHETKPHGKHLELFFQHSVGTLTPVLVLLEAEKQLRIKEKQRSWSI